jgi:hypothetical protein
MLVGDGFTDLVELFGPMANFRIFWSDMYFTCVPEHIKLVLATDNYVKGITTAPPSPVVYCSLLR